MRVCRECGVEQPIDHFCKSKKGKDGYAARCKKCVNATKAAYRKEHKDESAKKSKIYIAKYRKENKEVVNEQRKQYRKNNTESISEINKRYFDKNKGYANEYRKNNRDKFRMYGKNYYSSMKNLPNTLTITQWGQAKLVFRNCCAYCGNDLPLTRDHFIPVSKGGECSAGNIIPSCKSCNSKKHNSDFFEWYPRQTFYSKDRENEILIHLNCEKHQPSPCYPLF